MEIQKKLQANQKFKRKYVISLKNIFKSNNKTNEKQQDKIRCIKNILNTLH